MGPAIRSDTLRIIPCPSRVPIDPPWSWIYGFAILAEFHIEFRAGLSILGVAGARQTDIVHRADRFARQDRLAQRDVDSTQSCQHDMISVACVQDQELPV